MTPLKTPIASRLLAERNLAGMKFGKLTALERVGTKTCGRSTWAIWKCRCECGAIKEVRSSNLKGGHTKSCGCVRRQPVTHGLTSSSIYKIWIGMRARCNNPHNTNFKYYGARGIKVCKRWSRFEAFLADVGERPPGKTVGRIDNDLGYYPSNVRWETRLQQARNTRWVRYFTVGSTRLCMTDWAARIGITPATLCYHLKRNPNAIPELLKKRNINGQ